ncbi:MAG TPA: MBL fold metallo-hydrolase [Gemmataceae bacterium]|nr:MBL fold metallo-hydrolase [Gemmataceae bacterium]
MRFTVLASGSGGNASLVESAGFGVLIDVGLGPRQISSRLAKVGLSWSAVQAVLLTHTHTDHWKDATLLHLSRNKLPLWCHAGHHTVLRTYSDGFLALDNAGLVRSFEPNEEFELSPQLRCRALPVRHDGGATFGFRLEGGVDLFGQRGAIGYVADLGCWEDELAAQLADVDLLAVEFNHDVAMQHASGRTLRLIERVLGDEGHLSNVQAAALVRAVLERSTPGRLRHLVQLHLSRECNRPALARQAARTLLEELGLSIALHTAEQDAPGATLHLNAAAPSGGARRTPKRRVVRATTIQPMLPGLADQTEP